MVHIRPLLNSSDYSTHIIIILVVVMTILRRAQADRMIEGLIIYCAVPTLTGG